jgi:hypothetical protein
MQIKDWAKTKTYSIINQSYCNYISLEMKKLEKEKLCFQRETVVYMLLDF